MGGRAEQLDVDGLMIRARARIVDLENEAKRMRDAVKLLEQARAVLQPSAPKAPKAKQRRGRRAS